MAAVHSIISASPGIRDLSLSRNHQMHPLPLVEHERKVALIPFLFPSPCTSFSLEKEREESIYNQGTVLPPHASLAFGGVCEESCSTSASFTFLMHPLPLVEYVRRVALHLIPLPSSCIPCLWQSIRDVLLFSLLLPLHHAFIASNLKKEMHFIWFYPPCRCR